MTVGGAQVWNESNGRSPGDAAVGHHHGDERDEDLLRHRARQARARPETGQRDVTVANLVRVLAVLALVVGALAFVRPRAPTTRASRRCCDLIRVRARADGARRRWRRSICEWRPSSWAGRLPGAALAAAVGRSPHGWTSCRAPGDRPHGDGPAERVLGAYTHLIRSRRAGDVYVLEAASRLAPARLPAGALGMPVRGRDRRARARRRATRRVTRSSVNFPTATTRHRLGVGQLRARRAGHRCGLPRSPAASAWPRRPSSRAACPVSASWPTAPRGPLVDLKRNERGTRPPRCRRGPARVRARSSVRTSPAVLVEMAMAWTRWRRAGSGGCTILVVLEHAART